MLLHAEAGRWTRLPRVGRRGRPPACFRGEARWWWLVWS